MTIVHESGFFGVHCAQRKLRTAKVPLAGWSTMDVRGQSLNTATTALLEELIHGLLVGFRVLFLYSRSELTICVAWFVFIRKLYWTDLHDLWLYLFSCFSIPGGHSWQDLNLLGYFDLLWRLQLFDLTLFVVIWFIWNANWTKEAHWLLSSSFFVCWRLKIGNNFISFNNFVLLISFLLLRGRLQRVLF